MGFRGKFQDLALVDVLQVVQLTHKSGVLEIYDGPRHASVCFKEGDIVDARPHGVLRPEGATDPRKELEQRVGAAIQESLTWVNGEFEFDMTEPHEVVTGIRFPTQQIVLDALRILDELRAQKKAATTPEPKRQQTHRARVVVVAPPTMAERLRVALKTLAAEYVETSTLAGALLELGREMTSPAIVVLHVAAPVPENLRAEVGRIVLAARKVEVVTVGEDPLLAASTIAAGAWAHVAILRDGGPALAYLQSLVAEGLGALMDGTRPRYQGGQA